MATGIAAMPTCESPLTEVSAEGLKVKGVPASRSEISPPDIRKGQAAGAMVERA
ncbi:MAG: hypothetical protein M3460_18965 [Actinomycetota bacterium]|nr:hypothetical protein [Actinomycetota bacterium]